MSASSVVCAACNAKFTKDGDLLRHYRQTQSAKCIELYRQTIDYVPARADSEQPEMSPMRDDHDLGGNDIATPGAPEPERQIAEECFVQKPHITKFGGKAGAPLQRTEVPANTQQRGLSEAEENPENPWAPFKSQIDWQIARWDKVQGSTSTVFTDLLAINGVTEALGLSYKNSSELNKIIDKDLPSGRPVFTRQEIVIGGEAFDVYFHPIMECVRALYGDPEFAQDLIFAPERHYADADKTIRLYHDIHTAEWWWKTQKTLERRKPGATLVPVIISTDKTQTTMFRNKSAYPPSHQAYILIGYLPTLRLDHIKVAAARRQVLANLYHACMHKILGPLKGPGLDGVEMASGDGVVRRCHPILAIFAGDYPEQALVTGVKIGECPTCPVPRDELGSFENLYEPRDLAAVLEALGKADGDATEFTRACAAVGIKPIYHPFWEDLPFIDIFLAITPDVLHQLYQGVIKHIVSWLKEAFGPVEIDARCRRMPPNHNTRLFLKGITTLSRVSGTEHSQMCCILLGLIVDLRLPERQSTTRLICAVRGSLDFLYYAQYPLHSSQTLDQLNESLESFHANKSIFVDLGIWENFNLPKLHNISHYPLSIHFVGTIDNYNTEYTERLHIDFTKDVYHATNRKDEYIQMTLWLEQKEKHRHLQMTKYPSVYGVKLPILTAKYGAEYFRDAFARYASISVYHKIKFWNEDPLGWENKGDALDVVHVKPGYSTRQVIPAQHYRQGRPIGGRFDTVLVNDGTGKHCGVKGYHIGQVRVVFSLPDRVLGHMFPGPKPPKHLAYIEWFSKFPNSPDPNHGMYKISRPEECTGSIIPVANIRRSIHLFPQFGPVAPRGWTRENILELCTKFYVNPWSDRHTYVTVR
ncbi:hypothetical protein C8R43DRAFT_1092761 [Mycena crocata]|nr:hypothetical protein C8R43DRAFT_1092761 [Mycena crocata]